MAEHRFVVFTLDGQRYALALESVERIVRAVEITALPNSPPFLLGVIDVAGRLLPVLNIRMRFGIPERPVCPDDCFVIAQANARTQVLVVDEVAGVFHCSEGVIEMALFSTGLDHIRGVAQLPDGLVLIHDLEKFLSANDAHELDVAMRQEAVHGA